MTGKKRALGKGLSALLENSVTDVTSGIGDSEKPVLGAVATLPISQIEANPFQPRTHFDKEALMELSESIREHGLIQPVTVRKMGYDKFQLISGERRFRASTLAGLEEIPAYIRVANDQAMLEMALVENIQRENLDAIEIAIGYKRLIDECNITQEALSEKVSKNRTTVTNYLRLLKLPAEIQLAIRNKQLTMGHARALVGVEEDRQLAIFAYVLEHNLSVRETEELVRGGAPAGSSRAATARSSRPLPEESRMIREELITLFGTKVDLRQSNSGRGKITIDFASPVDLRRILEIMKAQ